jgi:hypothetical protein
MENSHNTPKILICGPKKSGKSSLARQIINSLLAHHDCVTLLEADCGQPQFGPPGFVSLTNIPGPILLPPHCILQQPDEMMAIGDVSAERNPITYINSIRKLFEIHSLASGVHLTLSHKYRLCHTNGPTICTVVDLDDVCIVALHVPSMCFPPPNLLQVAACCAALNELRFFKPCQQHDGPHEVLFSSALHQTAIHVISSLTDSHASMNGHECCCFIGRWMRRRGGEAPSESSASYQYDGLGQGLRAVHAAGHHPSHRTHSSLHTLHRQSPQGCDRKFPVDA